ncbi:MAG: hypothetical protein HY744_11420 [Deltaproteobacteria bacterium]|nr:hypothetical protein [Deltaproteobacteria bacterium]
MAQKYGVALPELAAAEQRAVRAAERSGARTVVFHGSEPTALIVPVADLDRLDPPAKAGGADALLALCGACHEDDFADELCGGLGRSVLFLRQ